MLNPIEWEGLEYAEKAALVAAGETSPLAFTALWFNVTQGDSFRVNWHHHYFDWVAKQVLDGELKTVVINIPPGGTKTEYWSIFLPVYCYTQFNRVRILNTSYSKDLCTENSGRSRTLVRSAEFQEFYGRFDIEKDKVDDWTLAVSGKRKHQLFSKPSGGQITGVRGGYMSPGFTGYVMADDWEKIDDLFSMTKRKKSHTRLINTLRSRRAHSQTPFIFVQQRGHVDDSTAFLLSGGMGLEVDAHVTIPALVNEEYIETLPPEIAKRCRTSLEGTDQIDGCWSYWPDKESVEDLVALREAHPYTFVSQYAQSPETLDGGIFNEEDFLYYGDTNDGADVDVPSSFDYRFITADTAQKSNNWNDWTVFAEWGVANDMLFRLSMQRDRMQAPQLRRDFASFVRAAHAKNSSEWGNLRAVLVEDKSSGTGLIQEVEGKLPVPITPVPRERDKLTRAMDVQPHHAARKVALPYGDGQNFEFVAEVAGFTVDDSHKYDDQTDVLIDALDFVFVRPNLDKRGQSVVLLSKRTRTMFN